MANVLAELFQNTANAIREKTGEQGTMKPAEFPEKIRSIQLGTGGTEPNLIPLSVTENGNYYPTLSIEHGKTYTFKNSYTQVELKAFYEAALGKSDDGMYAYLCANLENGNSQKMLGVIYAYGYYGLYISDGHKWLPEEFASTFGLASGWNVGADIPDLKPAETPSFSFETYEVLISGGLPALNPLFELPVADGFSYVEVNVEGGGASIDGVEAYTVTYIGADGSTLHTKLCIKGNTVCEPYEVGEIDIPIKESTPQYNYTFNGWSLTEGGTANENALFNITADRTVYAAFEQTDRLYSVRFWDGETLLSETQVVYGTTVTPPDHIKEGAIFLGWKPSNLTITADTDFHGEWVEGISFESATWAQIAQVSESGEASNVFNIGDERTITLTWADGSTEDCVIRVAAFNADTIFDETTGKPSENKAGITIDTKNVISKTYTHTSRIYNYHESDLRQFILNELLPALPEDLRAVIKPTMVPGIDYVYGENFSIVYLADKLSVLHGEHLNFNYNSSYIHYDFDGPNAVIYPIYTDENSRKKYNSSGEAVRCFITGSAQSTSNFFAQRIVLEYTGSYTRFEDFTGVTGYIPFRFAI